MSSSFKFNVPGLSQTTGEIRALNTAVLDLRNTMKDIGSQQSMIMQGFNGMVGQMQVGANSTASALNGAGGRGGGGGGSTPTGIPFNFSTTPSTAFDTMTSSLAADSNIGAMVAAMLMAPPKYAFNRFEEARGNAPGIASMLGPVATMNSTTIPKLIERLQEGTPVQGDLSNVLSALNQGAMMGYGDLNSAKGGSYFEGIRQMQAFTPGVGAGQIASMQNQWLSNTGGHQRALMLTGGAMSGFGAGGRPKTLQEWAESTLKWFEGQRPGKDRGKKFTKEELATQQFPGSNMDAWFVSTGVPEYMQEYFWQYVIGAAQTGSQDMSTILGARGGDLAMSRLRTQTAQGRREFQMLGSGTNYEDFNKREDADRWFTNMLGAVDEGLGAMLGGLLGPNMRELPTPLANLASTAIFSMGQNAVSSATSFFLGGGKTMGDPQRGRGRGFRAIGDPRRAQIGDVYGAYGGEGTSHMDPSFAGRVNAMMAANPNLSVTSGFRDGALQGKLHAAGVGKVAPAGQSMHSRGLAADLGPSSEFGWIVANAHRFGLESGANFDEPWHVGMPGTVPVGDAWGWLPDPLEDAVNKAQDAWAVTKAVGGSDRAEGRTSVAGFLSDPVGTATDVAGGVAGAVANAIPGMGTLVKLAETMIDAFQGIKGAMSGDFSGLFGGGGLFDISGIMEKGLSGLGAVSGMPLDQIASGNFGNAIAGWLGSSKGIGKSPQSSSVNWNEARPTGAGVGGGAVMGGSASVANILQKYGEGGSVSPANVSGKENAIMTALKAAAAAGFTGDELIAITAIAGRESGWNPQAFNGNRATGDQSYGLYQINMLGSLGPARRKSFGIGRNEELFDPNVSGRAAWITSSQGTNLSAWGGYKGRGNLFNAEKYVEPVYNIAKQAGFIGDPRRRAAVGDATSFAQYTPQVTAPTMMTMNAPRSAQVFSSPVTNENTFNIQVANDADARRVAFVVAEHLDALTGDNMYMVS